MSFHFNSIPSAVLAIFKGGASLILAVNAAVAVGITSSDTLTDIVFFLRHPERSGKPLTKSDSALIKEWLEIQKEINRILNQINTPDVPSGAGASWFQYAEQELKKWTSISETMVETDEKYFMASPYFGAIKHTDGETPRKGANPNWCAAFVNWCLHRSGHSHTGNASNRSFEKRSNWHFNALPEPRKGCVILVCNTENGTHSNHIAFLSSWKSLPTGRHATDDIWISGAKRLSLLGGNQSESNRDRVCRKNFYRKKIVSVKGKDGVKSPYLWPLRGPSNCEITSVPSKNGHFCGCNPLAL